MSFPATVRRITCVVPTLDEERRIADCIHSIRAQTYPAALVDVVVVDGGSGDRTRALVLEAAATDPGVLLLDNPDRIQSAGFNLAIQRCRNDFVALVSAHSELEPRYLEECVAEMERSGADNVGGRMEARGQGTLQRAVAAAMSSPVGIGGARQHYADRAGDVDSVWPGFFRRSVFDRVGLFRADLAVHEDYELNHRIRSSGGRVRFNPRIGAAYYVRPSLRALARQYFRYGRAKAGVARERPGVLRPYHLVPPLLTAALATTALAAPASRTARRSVAALCVTYVTALVVGTRSAGRGQPASVRAALPPVVATMHLCWGAGMWLGVLIGPPGGPAGRGARARV